EISPSDRIIDLGAGTGRNALLMAKYLSPEGKIVGLDISEEMISQFKRKCSHLPNVEIIRQRIDLPLSFENKFDKALISFVLHGFPQAVRVQIIENIRRALVKNGCLLLLDWNEFNLNEKPIYFKIPFRLFECKLVQDFISRDWKEILSKEGFGKFKEFFFFKNLVRLLKAQKIGI
ncbi:MAG: class I SAM-dependent methyltransferase, partial [Candidatus Aminicenantia bacterium]